jgi:hypothetical protein
MSILLDLTPDETRWLRDNMEIKYGFPPGTGVYDPSPRPTPLDSAKLRESICRKIDMALEKYNDAARSDKAG